MYIVVDDTFETADKINSDLLAIETWADRWLVNFSPPKTEELVISNKLNSAQPIAHLNNMDIKKVDHHKHLGVTFSRDLSWKVHIDEITAKANKRLGILRPLKHKVDRKTLECIYKTLIRPVMEYADVVWDFPSETSHLLDRLDKIQWITVHLIGIMNDL